MQLQVSLDVSADSSLMCSRRFFLHSPPKFRVQRSKVKYNFEFFSLQHPLESSKFMLSLVPRLSTITECLGTRLFHAMYLHIGCRSFSLQVDFIAAVKTCDFQIGRRIQGSTALNFCQVGMPSSLLRPKQRCRLQTSVS